MTDYRLLTTDELLDQKVILQCRRRALEKRGSMLNLTQKKELTEIRRAIRQINSIIGARHVQLPLL